jgi:excisionase family DNA binding protein
MSTQAPIVMTVEDLAAYLQVHPSTIYRLLKSRFIPAFKIGSDWRFNREAVDRWITQRESQYLSEDVVPPEPKKGRSTRRKSAKKKSFVRNHTEQSP